jgi:hypothetical protein
MSSDRQIAANQNNAKRSTGPRSEAGRVASRRNARRHGLATDIGADPAFHDDIEKLATALSLSSGIQKESQRMFARSCRSATRSVTDSKNSGSAVRNDLLLCGRRRARSPGRIERRARQAGAI